MRFTSLRLANWKNFARVEFPLRDRMYLVGPNAAGKSNLLDAFRFLSDLVSVGGGFQEAVEKRNGVSGIRSLAARRYPDIEISAALADDDSASVWEYELAFSQDNNRRPIVTREVVKHGRKTLLSRPDSDDSNDSALRSQTHLEQINVNKAFREVATFFSTIRYLHIVPQLVREPDRSVGRKNDPYGGTFLEQLATAPKRTSSSRLERIRKALAVAVPQLQELELYRDPENGTPHLRGRYTHWRAQGQWQLENQFSDGTLRLIGLLWAVLDGAGPLLLEEPELSLHEEIVKQLPALFFRIQKQRDRQIFVSTHSEAMLSSESVSPDEVLVIEPQQAGSRVILASESESVAKTLEVYDDLSQALRPLTAPPDVRQLSLFS